MTVEPSASIAPPDHQLPATTSKPPGKRRHRWIWAVILIAFGLLFYWIIAGRKSAAPAAARGGGRHMMEGPVPVVPVTATKGNLGVYLDAIGTVTPVYTDSITSQVTGVITAVHYREGQLVRKGDPLVDIDPRPYEAQLTEAQGILQRDQNLLAEARMDLVRYQQAWAKNAIPRQTLEDQEKLVLQDTGTVKNDEGTVQYDQVQLGFCHIVSPITGRVGLRLVDPGNLVTANSTTTLVVVTQIQPITVIFTISEDNLPQVMPQVRRGLRLSVEAWDHSNQNQIGSGRLTTVDNQIDTTTGTVKLRAEFPNANRELFPNQFVNTRLLVNTVRNQVMVPSSAIQHNGDTAFVFVLQPGPAKAGRAHPGNAPAQSAGPARPAVTAPVAPKAQYHAVMQTVTTGVTDNNNTAVQGIQAGTMVANSSFDKLQDGSDVVLTKANFPTAQSTVTMESSAP